MTQFGIEAEPCGGGLRRSARPSATVGLARVLDLRRSGRRSSRSARRPCANRARRPSAAGFRRDTICPGRNAAGRPARNASRRRRIRSSASAALGRPDGGDIPFRRFRDRRSETNVGSPPMVRRTSCAVEIGVDLLAERVEPRPGLVGERLRDARRLADALDAHVEAEFDIRRSPALPEIGAASDNAAWRRAEYGPRRSAGPRSRPGRSSPRPADRPRPRRADR